MDLTKESDVIELMKSSKSEKEWNDNCDKVKAANGDYPGSWFRVIMLSGLANDVMAKW